MAAHHSGLIGRYVRHTPDGACRTAIRNERCGLGGLQRASPLPLNSRGYARSTVPVLGWAVVCMGTTAYEMSTLLLAELPPATDCYFT